MPDLRQPRRPTKTTIEAHDIDLPAPGEGGGAVRVAYRVVRSARRRRTLELSVQGGTVTVRVPSRTPDSEIRSLLHHRAAWILRHAREAPPPALADSASVPYRGKPVALTVSRGARQRPEVHLDLFGLRVEIPRQAGEEAVRKALTSWLRERARDAIPARVEHRAQETGWQPGRVLVRDQKRRWGSCAADGTLRFNWRLVMLDEALLDYVVVHELAHLEHAHHGPAFWHAVEQVLPQHRALRRRLREEGRQLPL